MTYCKDCKFWSRWKGSRIRGECRITDEYSRDTPEAKFWALPYAGADGGTVGTMADYGCVQFEKK